MKYYYKSKKRLFIYMLIIIINIINIFALASCNSNKKNPYSKTELYGNSMGNIVNAGLAANTEQWACAQFKDGLYKMNLDCTGKEKITEGVMDNINIWKGWIYYPNFYSGNGEIYKIAPDGSNMQKINDEMSNNPIIKDGWIYYSTLEYITFEEVEFKIKKIKVDGTNQTDIVSEHVKCKEIDPSRYFFLFDDWIYYKSLLDSKKLYRIQDDGKNKSKVSDEIFFNMWEDGAFIVDQNWIYYIQPNDDDKLYRMKIDGTQKELVINKSIADINITDEYIFYTDRSENYKLYRRNKGSAVEIKLADYSVSDINIIEDWIYCRSTHSELKFYIINCDGRSNSVEIEKP